MKEIATLQEAKLQVYSVAYFLRCDKKSFRKGLNEERTESRRGGAWREVNREDFRLEIGVYYNFLRSASKVS